MPAVKAQLKHLRIAPRKVRLVADAIRRKDVTDAIQILSFLPKRASLPMKKLLQSAEANAKHNFHMEDAHLYVSEIRVDEGPVLKRYSPRAMGRATLIRKKTSHITLVLEERRTAKKPQVQMSASKKNKTPKTPIVTEEVKEINKKKITLNPISSL